MESEPSAKKKGKAVYVAKVGNVRVPVYKLADGRFCVVWRQVESGPRKREMFTVKKEATDRADEISRSLANSLADVLTLSSADRDNYRLAVQALAPLGIPLHAAVAEFIAARKIVAPHTLTEAANFFARGHIERREVPSTQRIVSELLEKARDDRRDEKMYVARLARDLGFFAAAFPDLSQASEEAIRAYLRALKTTRATKNKETGEVFPKGVPVSPRRRDNVRDGIVTLMRFARSKQYLSPDKISAAEQIDRVAEGGEVTTYHPERLAAILAHFATTDRDWLPWAALGAFAGLRTSEIFRLSWDAFRWDAGVIAIKRSIARKVRTARQAPILPVLADWLSEWRGASGFVVPRKWKRLEQGHASALGRFRKAVKIDWDKNALRHSFGSHRLAIVKSADQLAWEMGTSPAKIRENYNDPKPETEALQYFALVPPENVQNVVRFAYSA